MKDDKINEKEEIENLDNLINDENISIKIDDLIISQENIECILNEYQKKMEASTKEKNLILKNKEISFKNNKFSSLLNSIESLKELKENEKFEIIIDMLNFYNTEKNEEQSNILSKYLNNNLTEKGCMVLLCDLKYLKQIGNDLKKLLGEENKIKMLIKLYIVSKVPFLAFFSIQKIYLAKENIDILNEKILAYEIYEDLTLTKPIGYTLSQMQKSINYMNKMFQYQNYLNILYPGKNFLINIKETFWSDNIDFSLIVCDCDNEDIIKQRNCGAIIFGQSHLNDFISLSKQGNLSLCNQIKVSRLFIIRPSPFNPYTTQQLKGKLSSYISLFKFKDCFQDSIPIMMMNDENENVDKVYIDNKFLIREIKQKDNIIRQFFILECPHEVQCEIKILLSSKSKKNKNNNNKKYIPIQTIERYASKNLGEYFDDSYLSMFYTQVVLSGIFFLNLVNYPKDKMKVLVLGAGTGNINFFMNKVLNSNVEIDAVQLDKKVTELGKDYFGFNDYKKDNNKNENNNIKWYFQDAKNFVEEKNVENYYNLIIMNINNTNSKKERSPPNSFFEEKIIKKINNMLSNDGIYILYLMCKNSNIYINSIETLKKNFKQILFLENNDEFNKIYFCFKTNTEKKELLKKYTDNIKILTEDKNIANIKVIENSSIHIINKFNEINYN